MNLSAALRKLQAEHIRLWAAIALGISLILFAIEALHHPVDSEEGRMVSLVITIGRDTGIALLISVILGWSIEWVIRQRLLEDVFKASIGYILPDELKEEVRALYEAKFVCTEHVQESTLLPIAGKPEVLCLHTKARRTFKNVTSSRQELEWRVSLTEWFSDPDLPSRIVEMGTVLADGRQLREFTWGRDTEAGKINKIVGTLDEKIALDSDETCTCWYETVETKRPTDVASFVFEHLTRNPHAALRPQIPGMVVNVRFNTRQRGAVDKIGEIMRLRGTLVPYQGIELRWFRTQEYESWVKSEPGS